MTDLQPLANHLWQSTAFAALAGILTFALRKNRAQARYWLWFAASIKFLIPFSALLWIGASLAPQRTLPAAPPLNPSRFSNRLEQFSHPFADGAFLGAPAAQPASADLLPALLLAAWAIGFSIIAANWWKRWQRVRAAIRSAKPLALPLGIPALSSPEFFEPGVFGIRRPVLLLPDGIAAQLTPAQLEAILAHELCHIRRRDNLASAIHMAVEAIFWFHPLVWWLGARLLDERERACDEEVLRRGNDPKVYAEGILKICELYLSSPLECVAGVTGANLKNRIEEIMTHRAAFHLNAARKLLLTAAAALAVAGPLVIGLANAPRILAQTKSAKPTFDVISVKPLPPETQPGFLPEFLPGGRLKSTAPMRMVIATVFNLSWNRGRLTAPPDCCKSAGGAYDIEATGSIPPGLSDQARLDRERAMLLSLLADRFKMVYHIETKEMPVYALVVAKGGPKLQKSDIDEKNCPDEAAQAAAMANFKVGVAPAICHQFSGGQGRGLHARAASMQDLTNFVENWTAGRPLLDKTGLKGLYKFETKGWSPLQVNSTPPAPGTKGEDGTDVADMPTLFQIFEQLGLKMEAQKAKVDIYVIDHLEKPTEN